jgi:hypothetical protein
MVLRLDIRMIYDVPQHSGISLLFSHLATLFFTADKPTVGLIFMQAGEEGVQRSP